MRTARSLTFTILLAGGALLASVPAHALRCGDKVVREGMLDVEVLAHCGEPTAIRERGFVLRAYTLEEMLRLPDAEGVRFSDGNFYQHVLVTEYIYNFGPRKLVRKLRFEGGELTDIEVLGRGWREESN
ncbi:MAG TPA: DUF2845 domain-containing protein [Woeseiaceae bacterium]|jgi:hypothetical protein